VGSTFDFLLKLSEKTTFSMNNLLLDYILNHSLFLLSMF
jgi:hypothetical protein